MTLTRAGALGQTAQQQTISKEPGISAKATELLRCLNQLLMTQQQIRAKLFGSVPVSAESNAKEAHEPSCQELLARACQLASLLCGEASTIESRL